MRLPGKAYTLIFDETPKYLYARVTCETITFEIATDYLRDILDECRELRYTRLMIERDIPRTMPSSKIPLLASEFVKMGIDDLRIAFVDRRLDDLKLYKLAAMASRRLGLNVRVYTSRPEARRWLLDK